MQAIFFTNKSDKIVLNKELTENKTLDIKIHDTTSILSPVLILSTENFNINNNYVYLPIFNRYYYINNINIINNNLYKIELIVDVLMSFKNEILETKQNVIRNSNVYNMYLQDGNLQITKEVVREIKNLETPENYFLKSEMTANDYNFILNTL